MHRDAETGRVAAGQYGVILRSQSLATGTTDRMIHDRVVSGRWIPVAPGLYRVAAAPVSWRQRALASCLLAGPGAVVSHRAAAVLWGVSGFRPGPLDITVPLGRSSRNALATVHRASGVDGLRRDGIPVTRPARTVIDLASVVSGERLEEAVDDVLCRRLCSLDELAAEIGRGRGSPALRTVLGAWSGHGLAEGVAEMRVVRALLAAGLPDPVRQHEIRSAGQFLARVDLAYPAARLAIELDGFRWHAGRGPFRSDRVRGNRIEAAGWRLLRAAPEDIGELVDSAAAILRRAA